MGISGVIVGSPEGQCGTMANMWHRRADISGMVEYESPYADRVAGDVGRMRPIAPAPSPAPRYPKG